MKLRFLPVFAALLLASCAPVPTGGDDAAADHMMVRGDMPDVHGEHDDMTMDDMVHALEGLSGDAFDKAFLEMMIPHHQGAVDMAAMVAENAKHDELKRLATDIAASQQAEIDMMRQWLADWGYAEE